MSKSAADPANLSDVDLKNQGNKLFSVRKFDDAISCYSKAIVRF
jgi:STIP1 homology and U-box containing protein 1